MTHHFFYAYDQLEIRAEDVEEIMGFPPGQSPEPFPELIEKGLQKAASLCQIEGGFKLFDEIRIDRENETIQVEDQFFLPGKIVVTQLKSATSGALFVCTAGAGITDYAKKVNEEGDPFLSYVMDVIGSIAVDKAAEKLQDETLKEAAKTGQGTTDPFSPGYCKWSVADQKKLFSLLPPRFCGISLSDSSLMHPIKSVSGITGIGISCKRKGYQCHWCEDADCIYGKIRRQRKL